MLRDDTLISTLKVPPRQQVHCGKELAGGLVARDPSFPYLNQRKQARTTAECDFYFRSIHRDGPL